MLGFRRLAPPTQQAMCAAWLTEARRLRPSVAALRIYQVRRPATPRSGDRPASAGTKVLEYACG
jgi:hypothetical protein